MSNQERPKPIRIDPVKLISSEKTKTQSRKHSRKHSKKQSRKQSRKHSKKQSRKHSRKQSRKKESRKRPKLKKLTIKMTKEEEKKFQVPKIKSPTPINFKTDNRVCPERAVYQRLSPYFGQDKDNRPTTHTDNMTMIDLQKLKQKTRKSPLLNTLVKQNIQIRAGNTTALK